VSEWREVSLGEVVEQAGGFIKTGPFGSQLHAEEYTTDPDGVPVVMPKDMVSGRVARESVSRVDQSVAERLRAHRLAPGDLVLARRGDVGRFAFIEDDEGGWLCGTGAMRVHAPNEEVICPRFLRYAMARPGVANWLIGQAVGATMPNLNSVIVAEIPLRVPEPTTQRRVSAVLGAFDELIEINERRIELLEGLARSLYHEWFVRLRFPGRDDAPLIESEAGLVPVGWAVGTVGDFLDVIGGGTPSKTQDEYWSDGTIDWYTPSDLTRSCARFTHGSANRITTLGVAKSSAKSFPQGSVLMTSRATLGVLAIASHAATCNQGFIVLPPVDDVPPTFLREWLAHHKDALDAVATGATFKEITKGAFKRMRFVKPTAEILEEFAAITEPIECQIATSERANRALARTRDLLLRRLVTGWIDVSDVDLDGLLQEEGGE